MERVQRPQQLAGQFALADPPFPEGRAEDDVHVPDEGPDDVIRGELAGRDPVDRTAARTRDRRPDDQVDHGLGDHPEHVEVVRRPVLELDGDRRTRCREVELGKGADAILLLQGHGAHSADSLAKTSSITSSIGGSSTVRSCTS